MSPLLSAAKQDGEGKTVDERLVEGLAAGRKALAEISEQLARADMAAFETQGRFITSRYGEDGQQLARPEDAPTTTRLKHGCVRERTTHDKNLS